MKASSGLSARPPRPPPFFTRTRRASWSRSAMRTRGAKGCWGASLASTSRRGMPKRSTPTCNRAACRCTGHRKSNIGAASCCSPKIRRATPSPSSNIRLRQRPIEVNNVGQSRSPALSGRRRLVHHGAARPVQSETSRRGNTLGMIGMTIAILTTLAAHPPASFAAWALVVLGMALGGGIGAVIARRVPMTSMPELVAAFHSLVGMAAVLVAAGALYAPAAFGIGTVGEIHKASLVEMSIGVAIGAITFTGSVIAFLKLDGRMSGAPIMLPLRHVINVALVVGLIYLIVMFVLTENHLTFWGATLAAFLLGVLLIIPIGGADMPVVISMLNSYSGWAAAGIGFTLG